MDNYVGAGEVFHNTLAAAVSAGDGVIFVEKIGIALTDGEIGDLVAFRSVGVVNLPLKAAGSAMPIGTVVSFNETDGVTGGAAAVGDIENAGYVYEDGSAETDATVCIKLTDHAQSLKTA